MRKSSAAVPQSVAAVAFRLVSLASFVLLFIPAINPARVSLKINRNLSLFTSGLFYNTLTADLGRLLDKGWIQGGTMRLVFFSCMIACVGIFACGLGACASLGNDRLKRLAASFAGAGSLAVFVSSFGLMAARAQIAAAVEVEKVMPNDPVGIRVLLAFSVAIFALSVLLFFLTPKPKKGDAFHIEAPMELFLWLLPFLVLVFLFSYLPLFGWRYAFYRFTLGEQLSADKFVGFHWFTFLFKNPATVSDTIRVMKNTLAMSGLGLITSWCPLAFAVFLSEIGNVRVRRIVQTFTTIPNFISWVLVYAIAFCIFSTDGFISGVMVNSGAWESGKNLLMGGEHIWLKMLAWGMWKGLGWSAIMYIAAITSIDQQLYEAAIVDGAGRFQKMLHITIPELIPTYLVLLLLSIAGILNNGMEQYLVFENATNTDPMMVLDLYVYKLGIDKGVIPLSTVIGMVKSIVSVTLLFGANAISKAIRGTSIV
jgi:putative aldouronate transport system permease protein